MVRMRTFSWATAKRSISDTKSPLIVSAAVHTFGVNLFALLYSLNLGPERRAYLSVVFTITVGIQSLLLYGAGLRLRNTELKGSPVTEQLVRLLKLAVSSLLLFLVIILVLHLSRINFPGPLLFVSIIYFTSALFLFLTYEILFHLRKYRLLFVSEILIAPLIILGFSIFHFLFSFSVAVSVLLGYSFGLSAVAVFCIREITSLQLIRDFTFTQFKRFPRPLRQELRSDYFRLSIFGTVLERLDKFLLVFLVDPVLFSKFTLSISPIIFFRFIVNVITKIIVAKKSRLNNRTLLSLAIVSVYLGFGVILCLIIDYFSLNFLGGAWNIDVKVLFVFLVYEGLRVLYSLFLFSDLSRHNYTKYAPVTRWGALVVALILFFCTVVLDDNLFLAYSLLSFFLFATTLLLRARL